MTKKKRLQSLFTKLFWISFAENTKLSIIGTMRVVLKWQYALTAIVVILLFSMIFGVLVVGTFEWSLLVSALPVEDKFDILIRGVIRIFGYIESFSDVLILAVVILQGITISLLVFNIRQQRKSDKERNAMANRVGESTVASLIATLGLGCSACGTSLIIPLVSLISSSAVFLGTVTTAIVVIALLLLLHSAWKMGHGAYMFTVTEKGV